MCKARWVRMDPRVRRVCRASKACKVLLARQVQQESERKERLAQLAEWQLLIFRFSALLELRLGTNRLMQKVFSSN